MVQQRPPLVCVSVHVQQLMLLYTGLSDTKPGAAALQEFRRAGGGGCV